jgi:hypothetical protein
MGLGTIIFVLPPPNRNLRTSRPSFPILPILHHFYTRFAPSNTSKVTAKVTVLNT